MKLYFMPGACSLAPHIVLRETGLPFYLVEINHRTRLLPCGRDFCGINPKGYVPALELESGRVLTEVPVILQHLHELAPESALLPASCMERLDALEWLNFVATEIHKSFSPLFRPTTPAAFLERGREHLCRRLDLIDRSLAGQSYLAGTDASLADIYLFVLCRWLPDQSPALSGWPALQRHFKGILAWDSVGEALVAEGLRPIQEERT